jgi:hypothetical protein
MYIIDKDLRIPLFQSEEPTEKRLPRYLSLGAGVQSSTLALMAAYGEVPPIDAAIFADTQAEPQSVYVWLDWLEKEIARCPHPFPVHRVTAGSLEKEALNLRVSQRSGSTYLRTLLPAYVATPKGKALMGRRCTADYKVRVIMKQVRGLVERPRGYSGPQLCTQLIGISRDEAHRMKPATEPWTAHEWPLVDLGMTREDCKRWMAEKGYPEPPRSACCFCPFHGDDEWIRLRDDEPEAFAHAVQFDEQLRQRSRLQNGKAALTGDVFLHASLRPLSEVQFKDIAPRAQVSMFGNECEGLCGV